METRAHWGMEVISAHHLPAIKLLALLKRSQQQVCVNLRGRKGLSQLYHLATKAMYKNIEAEDETCICINTINSQKKKRRPRASGMRSRRCGHPGKRRVHTETQALAFMKKERLNNRIARDLNPDLQVYIHTLILALFIHISWALRQKNGCSTGGSIAFQQLDRYNNLTLPLDDSALCSQQALPP